MKHLLICSLLLGGALPLGGCLAGVATSAAGMAVRTLSGDTSITNSGTMNLNTLTRLLAMAKVFTLR